MCAHDSGNALSGVIDAQAFIGARRTSSRQSSAIATCGARRVLDPAAARRRDTVRPLTARSNA
ncbi:hypothetical protein [Paraburkholderia bannensis]|uniref:hypothetical protein n=1 Tax=Paraburkholderia bannensis TaxID=765414 RepID=UPI002AB067C9|nr:hypothetical protein [Paraburkholderia bannensis]